MKSKPKVLIIYAHAEKKSFCCAIKDTCMKVLQTYCEVKISDLYEMKLEAPLAQGDFKELKNPGFFKPQMEQLEANKMDFKNYIDPVKIEHEKLKWADIILFIFPLYWFSFPGVMKNWIDRVFSFGFAYGSGHSLEGKKAMVLYTTGGPANMLSPMEPAMFKIMFDMTFGFCSLKTIKPFVAYSAARITQDERVKYLKDLEGIMAKLPERELYVSPK